MKIYQLKLSEPDFVMITSKLTLARNYLITELNKAKHEDVIKFYYREIDELNALFDIINKQCKTNF